MKTAKLITVLLLSMDSITGFSQATEGFIKMVLTPGMFSIDLRTRIDDFRF